MPTPLTADFSWSAESKDLKGDGRGLFEGKCPDICPKRRREAIKILSYDMQ
jgi:hypothetical protein